MGTHVKTDEIRYLAFEGGGGRGVVYKGAVEALENKFYSYARQGLDQFREAMYETTTIPEPDDIPEVTLDPQLMYDKGGILPLFPLELPLHHRHLKGIAGSSAGAITAFMLACGMTSEQMEEELEATIPAKVCGVDMMISKFEEFFEEPSKLIRKFDGKPQLVELDRKFPLGLHLFATLNMAANIPNLTDKASLHLLLSKEQMIINSVLLRDIIRLNPVKRLSMESIGVPSYPGSPQISIPGKAPDSLFGKSETEWKKYHATFRKGPPMLSQYLHSLLMECGALSGAKVREYFAYILNKYVIGLVKKKGLDRELLPKKPGTKDGIRYKAPEEYTFSEFFNITGVDLVVTSVNLVQNRPLYFSVTYTPDFPVVDAIGISMNLPFIFKPYWIDADVNTKATSEFNLAYYGMHYDGGFLNNYPINAFNKKKGYDIPYLNSAGKMWTLAEPQAFTEVSESHFHGDVLGFRLEALEKEPERFHTASKVHFDMSERGKLPFDTIKKVRDYIHPQKEITGRLGTFLESLYGTLLFPTEEGKMTTEAISKKTILVNTGNIDLTDFAGPKLNLLRSKLSNGVAQTQIDAYVDKNALIRNAKAIVDETLI